MKAMTLKFQLKKQLKFLKDNEFICMCLDFMVNQKHASQEFLHVLLFHIVSPHYTTLTNT